MHTSFLWTGHLACALHQRLGAHSTLCWSTSSGHSFCGKCTSWTIPHWCWCLSSSSISTAQSSPCHWPVVVFADSFFQWPRFPSGYASCRTCPDADWKLDFRTSSWSCLGSCDSGGCCSQCMVGILDTGIWILGRTGPALEERLEADPSKAPPSGADDAPDLRIAPSYFQDTPTWWSASTAWPPAELRPHSGCPWVRLLLRQNLPQTSRTGSSQTQSTPDPCPRICFSGWCYMPSLLAAFLEFAEVGSAFVLHFPSYWT